MPTIGRYEIEREIGRGAMGVVYLAQDPHLHRQVAVKTYSLPDGISEEMAKQFHERFLREARAAASLSHPGIVTVYDAGEDPARRLPYIAMEFVKGETLKQRLDKGGRLNPTWVFAFGAVLADALNLAHRAGVVHRDIKPANILIREGDGVVKIVDFGVARLKTSDLTQTGASLGSPSYMSPEQIRGGDLDGRSDLFSLAVVLYEAFSGKRPFHGDDLVSLAYSIAHDTQVPLAHQLRGCPAGLDKFFDRALSKNPEDRFADGAAFRQALLAVGKQLTPEQADRTVADADTMAPAPVQYETVHAGPGKRHGATPDPPGRGKRGRLILASVAVALIAVGLAAAAYLKLARPAHPRLSSSTTAGVSRTEPSVERAPDQGEAGGRGNVGREGVAGEPGPTGPGEKAAPGKGAASREVEPVPVVPQIPRQASRKVQVTVPAGTEIQISLDKAIGSSSSHAGDGFTARITEPVLAGDRVAIPVGSSVHGLVSQAIPAKKGLGDKAGTLSLSFDRVMMPAGSSISISSTMTRVASGSGKKTAGIIGGSAAGGALLGKVFGGKNKNAAVGSVLGGAIGTGIAAGTKGEDVDLPAGSPLSIKLDHPLTISLNP
jgi:tRNA A-37 threonylcarbamoyl transferase component Bud32